MCARVAIYRGGIEIIKVIKGETIEEIKKIIENLEGVIAWEITECKEDDLPF